MPPSFVPEYPLGAEKSSKEPHDRRTTLPRSAAGRTPDEVATNVARGIAYAGLGRKADAVREGQRALELMPVSKDAYRHPFHVEEMARIYAMVGDRDAAVGQLEHLMSIPFDLAPPGLRLDPTWDSLRDHPRFQTLVSR